MMASLSSSWLRLVTARGDAGGPSGRAGRTLRLLRGDVAYCTADAIAVSSNPYLEGTRRKGFWRFTGRKNADGAVREAGGAKFAANVAGIAAVHSPLAAGRAVVVPSAGALRTRCRWIVHCVGPDMMSAGSAAQRLQCVSLLETTFAGTLSAATAAGACSLAVPAIGTGILGFAPADAAGAAFRAARMWLHEDGTQPSDSLSRVDLIVWSDHVWACWPDCAREVLGEPDLISDVDQSTPPGGCGLGKGDAAANDAPVDTDRLVYSWARLLP